MTGSDITALANKMKASAFHGTKYYETCSKPHYQLPPGLYRIQPARLTLIIAADVTKANSNHIARCLVGIDRGRGPADHSDVYLDPLFRQRLKSEQRSNMPVWQSVSRGFFLNPQAHRPGPPKHLTRRLYAVPNGIHQVSRDLHTLL